MNLADFFAKPLTPRLSGDGDNDNVNDKVIYIIKGNDKVTAKENKTHFKESIATKIRDITILKIANVLRREGSDKDGRWIVLI